MFHELIVMVCAFCGIVIARTCVCGLQKSCNKFVIDLVRAFCCCVVVEDSTSFAII